MLVRAPAPAASGRGGMAPKLASRGGVIHQLTGAAVTTTEQDCPSAASRPVPSSCRVSSATSDRPSPCRATEQDHPSVASRPVMLSRRASSVNIDSTGPLGATSSGPEEQDPPVDTIGGGEQQMVTSSVALGAVSWIEIVHKKPRRTLVTSVRIRGVPPVRALTAMRVTAGTLLESGRSFRRIDS